MCVAKNATHPRGSYKISSTTLRAKLSLPTKGLLTTTNCVTNKMTAALAPTDPVTELLKRAKTIAVVGLSDNPMRVSHGVSAYMQSHGYRIIPVNPRIESALCEKAYASLREVPEKIEIVNIFRRPQFVEEVVDEAIRLKVPAIWMQEDVIHEKAAEQARQAGIFVVMDRCILKEHRARFR